MPFIRLGKIKCCFCKEKKGLLHSVHAYGLYGAMGKRIFYHHECLLMVEEEPEKFGHAMVDMAIHIHDLSEGNIKKTNSTIVKKFRNNVEELQRKNFERMMPRRL
jgi:hypothetical protein